MFGIAALKNVASKSKLAAAAGGHGGSDWPAGAWVALAGDDGGCLRRALSGPGPAMLAAGGGDGRIVDPERCVRVVLDVWGRGPPADLFRRTGAAPWLWARAAGPVPSLGLLDALVALPSLRCVVLRDFGQLAVLPGWPPGSHAGVPALLQHCRRTGISIVATFVARGGRTSGHAQFDAAPCTADGAGVELGRGLVRQFVAWASVRAQT